MDKTLDNNKGRWRNVIVSFRMSPEELDDECASKVIPGLTNRTT